MRVKAVERGVTSVLESMDLAARASGTAVFVRIFTYRDHQAMGREPSHSISNITMEGHPRSV